MRRLARREFLKGCAGAAAAAVAPGLLSAGEAPAAPWVAGVFYEKEARWYQRLEGKRVHCLLCPRGCEVPDGVRGYCEVRENRAGTYYTLVWGNPCARHVDPVEKKPLFHFLPGSKALSLATAGCNIECKFCQNWDISQARPEQLSNYDMPPSAIVELAKRSGSRSIAFTYSEPVVFSEYVYDSAQLARQHALDTVIISNGYINKQPLADLLTVLSAVKIDLKAYTEEFYKRTCSATLKPVLDTLLNLAAAGAWFEVVYLVIPTLNDRTKELEGVAKWLVKNVGPDVPVHFSRFHPNYLLRNLPRTPPETVQRARKIALDAGMHYAYTGNLPGDAGESTYCPTCGKIVVGRYGYIVTATNLKHPNRSQLEAQCAFCGGKIKGIWA